MLSAALLAYALLPLSAPAASRFPPPQFEVPHPLPRTEVPPARAEALERLDVLVLLVALALAAWLALKARSRRGLFLLTLACLGYFGFYRKGCICPVGSIQDVTLALADPAYAIPLTALAFFALPLLFALLFGRVFCAAVCPLGAAQDIVILKPLRLPAWLRQPLGLLPHLYLGLAVLFVATGAGFVVCPYDPFVGFFRLSGPRGMLILGAAILLAGTVIARPYCRFLCPYGVLLGWMSRFSRWHLAITPTECIQCRLCENACPFDAILPANTDDSREKRNAGRRRLGILLLLLPVFALLGGWVASRLDTTLARAHRTVRLAERIAHEDAGLVQGTTNESLAFRSAGTPSSQLFADADAVRRQFRFGGWFLGGFAGLAFGASLIALSVRRTRSDYEPDRGACLSCGRCFRYCPKDTAQPKSSQPVK